MNMNMLAAVAFFLSGGLAFFFATALSLCANIPPKQVPRLRIMIGLKEHKQARAFFPRTRVGKQVRSRLSPVQAQKVEERTKERQTDHCSLAQTAV